MMTSSKFMQRIREEKGFVLVFAAVASFAILASAALSIDISYVLTSKAELQNAVDSAALAGASALMLGTTEAVNRASIVGSNNYCAGRPVSITAANISFPTPEQVCVASARTVNLFFAPVLGMRTKRITASATAEVGTIVATAGMRPWAIPDLGYPTGSPVLLKPGELNAPSTVPSFYYCVDYPPLNRGIPDQGASEYRDKIIHGFDGEVYINDVIQVEPGNMQGPTRQGVNDLIDQDPNAFWNGSEVVNSQFPGYSSPRIVKLPLYNANIPPDLGRDYVTCIGLAAFFVVGMHGDDVIGVYMGMTTGGKFGSGYSFLKSAKLIQ